MPRMGSRKRAASPARPLFDVSRFEVKPAWTVLLRGLAERPVPPAGAREARVGEERAVIGRLRRMARELGVRFGLRPAILEAEREGVTEHYGVCYAGGLIRIRLRHAVTGKLLKESSLVDTLCHELAHLRHFDHGPRFRELYLKVLAEARALGFYRPGPEPNGRQRSLFHAGACGLYRRPPEASTRNASLP